MTTSTAPRPGRAADPRPPAGARPPRRRRPGTALPYLLLAPAAAVLALVLGYPLVRLVLISFQDYGLRALFTGVVPWTGWSNYRAVCPTRTWSRSCCAPPGSAPPWSPEPCDRHAGRADARALGRRMRTAVTLCLIAAWAVPTSPPPGVAVAVPTRLRRRQLAADTRPRCSAT
ncbi:hypothetical protein [Streptacidiphilus sp. P02-A3a]|uniref:hypothetical protein n=1 Tax=Streptacidiphilus sp. P02-A3a TaxID=2704468 RepID=UPI0015F8D000|nr:hypothetical protein [Streptacidiphilus sp. P02-A3a]QMU66822.1 hypothetical protein GXP74_21920 [Streptacidiphilus sp. P02-A3a]